MINLLLVANRGGSVFRGPWVLQCMLSMQPKYTSTWRGPYIEHVEDGAAVEHGWPTAMSVNWNSLLVMGYPQVERLLKILF